MLPCSFATDSQDLWRIDLRVGHVALSEPLKNHWQYFFPSLSVVDGLGTFVGSEHGSVLSEYEHEAAHSVWASTIGPGTPSARLCFHVLRKTAMVGRFQDGVVKIVLSSGPQSDPQ
jgi:hypothetical protein